MKSELLTPIFNKYKEQALSGRYIHPGLIEGLVDHYSDVFKANIAGSSVMGLPIYRITVGNGPLKVLMWSQMHGNESTTTKALFDLLRFLESDDPHSVLIRNSCTLSILPMLSPDGAKAYTRVNAAMVDLNRDAQELTQPESKVLRRVYNDLKPDFCYNLHGQRTIFSAGDTNLPATVSFLSPAEDESRTITETRRKAMELISEMNMMLQEFIPGQIGRYDDGFNLNCVGDTFQSSGTPTVLFEAGHFKNDYHREKTREFIFYALLHSLVYISTEKVKGDDFLKYFEIPENKKLFFDIIVRNFAKSKKNEKEKDIGILFKETLIAGELKFIPQVEKMGDLNGYYGHFEIDAAELGIKNFEIAGVTSESIIEMLRNM